MTESTLNRTAASRRTAFRVWVSFGVIVLMLAVAGALTLARRRQEFQVLTATTEKASVLTVAVIHPTVTASGEDLTLPATLQAFMEAPIYARTTGYLQKWYFDIGSHVRQGDVLADLDTPDVDQELAQVRASREQTVANLALAKSSAERWVNLRKSDSVSQQEVDEKQSAVVQLQATLSAADATVKRLEDSEAFKHVRAPFDGVVTARNVEVGTLIGAGPQQPLFRLAQMNPIRVFAAVPEAASGLMRPGVKAYVELAQFPGEKFEGEVARTSGVIDPSTRTLLTEIDVPNHNGRLLPGGFAQVHLNAGRDVPRLQAPINTLLFRGEGVRAAVVDAGNRVHLRTVTIGRDFGSAVEILQGLTVDDWLVLNPADSIEDGQAVNVEKPKAPARAGGGPGQ
jgi:RND family efflux transporter MFP subunit